MATLPHQNPENGYALRLSKHLPKQAANIAYVHTDTPAPSKNIVIQDLSSGIPENTLRFDEQEIKSVSINDDGFLTDENGVAVFTRPDVLLTNEFSLDAHKTPLFYVYYSRYLFDASRSILAHQLGAAELSSNKLFEEYKSTDRERFVYMDDKIRLFKQGNQKLSSDEKYKIILEKAGEEDTLYRILILTNFTNSADDFRLHYPAQIVGQKTAHQESLNPRPLFVEKTASHNTEREQNFELISMADNTYRVKLNRSNEDLLVTVDNRPPHEFTYEIRADIKTRFSDKNPANIRIGLIYINDTIINAVKLNAVMKKIVYSNPYMPAYLTFENPHHQTGFNQKSDAGYWLADVHMPREHWLDYDVIVITGYGQKDLTSSTENMRAFLAGGGILMVDNAGTGSSVLNMHNQDNQQTFISDISFSQSNIETTSRQFTSKATMSDRYYEVTAPQRIGQVSPSIQFNNTENVNDWDVYMAHQNNSPVLMSQQKEGAGRLIISNMGWMLDILYNKKEAITFFTNFLLYCLENRQFKTPTFKENVYHRDDLYPIDYKNEQGDVFYQDDRSDEDTSQIVAKKIISDSVGVFTQNYLPTSYRSWQSATFETFVSDNSDIALVNASFESLNPEAISSWQATTLNAFPGHDFVKFSGETAFGEQTSVIVRDGLRSLHVRTTNAAAFFEQEVGVLQPNTYKLHGFVKNDGFGGVVAVYKTDGTLIQASAEEVTKSNWHLVEVSFELTEATAVTIRYGAHNQNKSVDLYFDDFGLSSIGVIRMTPEGGPENPLYAYAIAPRGKNAQLNLFEQTHYLDDFIKQNDNVEAILTIKSFVYQWYSAESRFKKEYGNQKDTMFSIASMDKEKILGNIQRFLPPLKSGIEWARKDRVYYEVSLRPGEDIERINISIYDPSTDQYFFTPDGRWVLNHDDVWWNGVHSTVEIRAELLTYNVLATSSNYAIRLKDVQQIKVLSPGTEDERNRWYLQIQNGSFVKEKINMTDSENMHQLERPDYYKDFLSGTHQYGLPEYARQTFYPLYGQRLIEDELAVYIDNHTIKVARGPLEISEDTIIKERVVPLNEQNKVFTSRHVMWQKQYLPKVYYDENQNGLLIQLTDGFEINYREGRIYFDTPMVGTIYVDYRYDNFQIIKRHYVNKLIRRELLASADNFTFRMKREHIAVSPAPVFYKGTVSDSTRIHPANYHVDYDEGTVTFFESLRQRIYADYTYYEEEELEWTDANQYSGEISLKQRISFKDEIYVTYLIAENNLEYKGYYDEESQQFMHLDLNPTAGHTFSLPQKIGGQEIVMEVAGEKLLNKAIYLYLLPQSSVYYKTKTTEGHCLRHCFTEASWQKVKTANPSALLLATIKVRENTDRSQIIAMDARRYGGGLKAEISQENIEKRVGYTSAFWDIGSFDGMAYYKNGVTVIRVPNSVLTDNGGFFTEKDVQDIINKYLAFGIYAIVEYTDGEAD